LNESDIRPYRLKRRPDVVRGRSPVLRRVGEVSTIPEQRWYAVRIPDEIESWAEKKAAENGATFAVV